LIASELSFFAAFVVRRAPSAGAASLLGEGDREGVGAGDGGGVCSYFVRVAGCAEAEDGESSLCDRFNLFVWGYSEGEGEDSGREALLVPEEAVGVGVGVDEVEVEVEADEARLAAAAAARAAWVMGTWMPREGRERDLRLVLYGIMEDVLVCLGDWSFFDSITEESARWVETLFVLRRNLRELPRCLRREREFAAMERERDSRWDKKHSKRQQIGDGWFAPLQ